MVTAYAAAVAVGEPVAWDTSTATATWPKLVPGQRQRERHPQTAELPVGQDSRQGTQRGRMGGHDAAGCVGVAGFRQTAPHISRCRSSVNTTPGKVSL
jgi:hypothetical protein